LCDDCHKLNWAQNYDYAGDCVLGLKEHHLFGLFVDFGSLFVFSQGKDTRHDGEKQQEREVNDSDIPQFPRTARPSVTLWRVGAEASRALVKADSVVGDCGEGALETLIDVVDLAQIAPIVAREASEVLRVWARAATANTYFLTTLDIRCDNAAAKRCSQTPISHLRHLCGRIHRDRKPTTQELSRAKVLCDNRTPLRRQPLVQCG